MAVGPGVYALSEMRSPALGGGVAARQAVLVEGASFCRSLGRRFSLMDARPAGDPFTPYWPTAFDATFACK